jgi:hypothetical protein
LFDPVVTILIEHPFLFLGFDGILQDVKKFETFSLEVIVARVNGRLQSLGIRGVIQVFTDK